MKSKLLFIKYLIIGLIATQIALANGTGKIAGLVKDKANGEPMVGVNVVVKREGIGSATDANGYFSIINVKPGKHDLTFQFIGYATVNATQRASQSGLRRLG